VALQIDSWLPLLPLRPRTHCQSHTVGTVEVSLRYNCLPTRSSIHSPTRHTPTATPTHSLSLSPARFWGRSQDDGWSMRCHSDGDEEGLEFPRGDTNASASDHHPPSHQSQLDHREGGPEERRESVPPRSPHFCAHTHARPYTPTTRERVRERPILPHP
jgi:hypothetical protein